MTALSPETRRFADVVDSYTRRVYTLGITAGLLTGGTDLEPEKAELLAGLIAALTYPEGMVAAELAAALGLGALDGEALRDTAGQEEMPSAVLDEFVSGLAAGEEPDHITALLDQGEPRE